MGVFYSLACRTKKLFEPCDQILELMRGRLSGAIEREARRIYGENSHL